MTGLRIVALTSYGEHTALTGGRLRRDNLLLALRHRGHHLERFDVPARPGPPSAVRSVATAASRAFRGAMAAADVALLGDVFCLPAVPLIRRGRRPIVLDLVDSPYRLVASDPRDTPRERLTAAANSAQLVPVMQVLYPLVDAVTYISQEDIEWDEGRVRHSPRTAVVPNGIAPGLFALDLSEPPDDGYVAWLADWDYPPNRDSLRWFVEDVAPQLPDHVLARVRLFGAGDPWTLRVAGRAFERARAHMRFAGFVESLDEVYNMARAVVAPVSRGAGVNNKVLEPLAAGRQLLTTDIGTRGLPPNVLEHVETASANDEFAKKLCDLLDTPWDPATARQARDSVHSLSWGRAGELMEDVLTSVAAIGRGGR
ncbi:glycosyltransferase [Actinomycetospora termitidis]|uniref:Glycosyltransferase n=1 Tax=Actinomycetospora termitidis TaxID=3053470 RepID=A0ABT7M1Z3_9PSEU|nr:glycosyltransferase [Actinomycetospora sp. Odt1-22]MDL5154675.1 glycosyltransferase [Actinomycetospora sp. Odt1-22]